MTRSAVRSTISGTHGSPARPGESAHGVTALDVWAVALPAVSFVEITVVGRLMLTELMMLLMLPWLWSASDRLPMPRWFVALWAAWLLGQIATDLVVKSAYEDFARGWAAIAFTMTNFAAVLVLASTPRRARLFALGLASAGVLGYLLAPSVNAMVDPWKWALALPVGLAIAAATSGATGGRRPWLAIGAFAIFGVVNLVLGYRSLGGISIVTSGILAISAIGGRPADTAVSSVARLAVAVALLVVATVGTLQLYSTAAASGLLGYEARTKFEMQSGALGVLVGGRSEVLVSSQAIIDSPVLGHGSWAKDFAYIDLLADRLSSLGYEGSSGISDVALIPAHSYILGSWVWAGILGAIFWVVVAGHAVLLLLRLLGVHLDLSPLLVLSAVLLLWDIAFSPYGFSARMTAPFFLALSLLGLTLTSHRPGVKRSSESF